MMAHPFQPRRESAVLVPVFRGAGGELRLVLVRRGDQGVHGGQLAFPGGKSEPADASPLDTALRETREEIGLTGDRIEILAQLPTVETLTTGFLIKPFLARVRPPAAWQCQEDEIAEVIEVIVKDLIRPEVQGAEMMHFPAWLEPQRVAFIRVGPHRLWGATYRIVEPLLPHLLAGEWIM